MNDDSPGILRSSQRGDKTTVGSDDTRPRFTLDRLLADHVDVRPVESERPTLERTPAGRTDACTRTPAEPTRR